MSWATYVQPIKRPRTCNRCRSKHVQVFRTGTYRSGGRWRNDEFVDFCEVCGPSMLAKHTLYSYRHNFNWRGFEVRPGYTMPDWFYLSVGAKHDPIPDDENNAGMYNVICETLKALENGASTVL